MHKTQQQAKALRFNLQPFNLLKSRNPEIQWIFTIFSGFLYCYDPKSWQKPPKHFSLDAVYIVTFYYLQYQLYII